MYVVYFCSLITPYAVYSCARETLFSLQAVQYLRCFTLPCNKSADSSEVLWSGAVVCTPQCTWFEPVVFLAINVIELYRSSLVAETGVLQEAVSHHNRGHVELGSEHVTVHISVLADMLSFRGGTAGAPQFTHIGSGGR